MGQDFGQSSRNSTRSCAKLASPGLILRPPPTSVAIEADDVCGARPWLPGPRRVWRKKGFTMAAPLREASNIHIRRSPAASQPAPSVPPESSSTVSSSRAGDPASRASTALGQERSRSGALCVPSGPHGRATFLGLVLDRDDHPSMRRTRRRTSFPRGCGTVLPWAGRPPAQS